MRHSLRCFAILTLFLLFSSTKLFAESKQDTINGIIYRIVWRTNFPEDKGASVIGYTDFFSGVANILPSVEGAPVESVGGFTNCTKLTSINIPSPVQTVGSFENCTNLKSVTIGDSVTKISTDAFSGCDNLANLVFYPRNGNLLSRFNTTNLKYLAIGKNVESIPYLDLPKLESIAVNGANLNYDSRDNCNAIIEKSTNKLILGSSGTFIPNSVTSIGESAFDGRIGLTSIDIPNSVTTIEKYAFAYCENLKNISISDAVTTIDGSAFYACAPKVLTWDAKHCESNGGMTTTEIEHVYIGPEVDYIPREFVRGSKITELNLPNSITVIGACAFSECTGLTSLTIPESLKYTELDAFGGCVNITELFFNAKKCLAFNRHYNVYDYDRYPECAPFFDLEKVIIGPDVEIIPSYFLSYCPKVQNITIPSSVSEIGFYAFIRTGLVEIDLPNSIKSIHAYTFWGCSSLAKINITNSVTLIECGAFGSCTSLSSITIPQSVDTIGALVFNNCSSLKKVYWNAKHCTFNNDYSVYQSSFLSDEQAAPFMYLGNHYSVIISHEVESIGPYIFYSEDYSRNELDTVTCYATTPPLCGSDLDEDSCYVHSFTINNYYDCINSILRVPESAIDAYRNDYRWGWFRTFEPIPNDELITISGDVDGDGRISIEDVTSLINILLRNATSSTTGADVNADGRINIDDVTTLINLLLRTH